MLVTRHSLVPSLMKVNLYTTIALRISVMQFEYLAIIFLKFENYNFYICSQNSKANTNSKPPIVINGINNVYPKILSIVNFED